MIRIAFCDDNPEYRAAFSKLLRKYCDRVFTSGERFEIVGAFESGEQALAFIAREPIDLFFLDIDMPGMSGFELAKVLNRDYKKTLIVFISAYDNFVYSAFEYYPFAFLRKERMENELPPLLLRVQKKQNESARVITLNTAAGEMRVDADDILYAESERNYLTVHTSFHKTFSCRCTLTEFEEQVRSFDFFRIHSAFIVNLEYVDRTPEKGYLSVAGKELPIAQRRVAECKRAYMDDTRRCFYT